MQFSDGTSDSDCNNISDSTMEKVCLKTIDLFDDDDPSADSRSSFPPRLMQDSSRVKKRVITPNRTQPKIDTRPSKGSLQDRKKHCKTFPTFANSSSSSDETFARENAIIENHSGYSTEFTTKWHSNESYYKLGSSPFEKATVTNLTPREFRNSPKSKIHSPRARKDHRIGIV